MYTSLDIYNNMQGWRYTQYRTTHIYNEIDCYRSFCCSMYVYELALAFSARAHRAPFRAQFSPPHTYLTFNLTARYAFFVSVLPAVCHVCNHHYAGTERKIHI